MSDEIRSEFGTVGPRPKVKKKLYNGRIIFTGLIIFFALVTLPLWSNLGRAVPTPKPKIDTPVIQKMPQKDRTCVQSKTFMRNNHMQLLDEWRNETVRKGNREYVGLGGKKYTASLQNTCMECHSNKTQFCDQCHNYVGITPYCWGCHLTMEKKLAEGK